MRKSKTKRVMKVTVMRMDLRKMMRLSLRSFPERNSCRSLNRKNSQDKKGGFRLFSKISKRM